MEEELKSMFDEITKRIAEEEDNAIAKAFAIYSADLLRRNGIVPIMTKVELPFEECSETNKYQIALRYGYVFETLDTSEHDKQIMDDVIGKIYSYVKRECNPYGKPTLDFESGKQILNYLKQMKEEQND